MVCLSNSASESLGKFASIVDDSRDLIRSISRIIRHYYKEAYKCADALTRRDVRQEQGFVTFDILASDVLLLLYLDKFGMYYDSHYVSTVQIF